MTQQVRILSGEQVRQCLPMDRAIDAMASAFGQLALDKAQMPLRTHLDIEDDGVNNVTLVMPSYLDENKQIGVKLLSLCKDNPQRGLPVIQAVVLLMDVVTGQVVAMMDGSSLTAIRTGAACGLATRLLARDGVENAVIFGAGVQGRTQLEGVVSARPSIRRAVVFDQSADAMRVFADEMSQRLGIEVKPGEDRSCLAEADVICTATPSGEPLFAPDELKPGVHVNAVGSYRLDMHELPEAFVAAAKVVVDDVEVCLSETADLILPICNGLMTRDDIHAELGELIVGAKLCRTSDNENTLFKSVGLAIQDLAAASAVLELAEQEGLGVVIDL